MISGVRLHLCSAELILVTCARQDIIAKAVTEFVDIVHRCMASAFGAEGSDDSMAATDVELCNRLIGHLTVTCITPCLCCQFVGGCTFC